MHSVGLKIAHPTTNISPKEVKRKEIHEAMLRSTLTCSIKDLLAIMMPTRLVIDRDALNHHQLHVTASVHPTH